MGRCLLGKSWPQGREEQYSCLLQCEQPKEKSVSLPGVKPSAKNGYFLLLSPNPLGQRKLPLLPQATASIGSFCERSLSAEWIESSWYSFYL